ncbi:hypothetical protein [Nonomuraea aurantiaca]|uniref:hypothetical protein n=1 Tax=Nonomuraea aurantiaca TaxID=2878562 RepID=UPI001CD966A9|nr:hypothetical protein [Nonomuraea aurantiaca]MCA2226511.1 hypothetical protein [Nonomuraea aurantiaca]
MLVSASMISATLVVVPVTAHAAAPSYERPHAEQVAKPKIRPVPAVRQPAPAAVNVPMEASLARRDAGSEAVGPQAPEVTTPAGPTLVNEITAEAAKRVGARRPDPKRLLPDTGQAATLAVKNPVAGLFDRLGSQKVVSALTYRLCVESEAVPVSCSVTRPVGVPAAADVTGDGMPDLAADLVPTASPQDSSVGLGFAVRRLPGAEANLKAQVWAEYDGRVSVGFDGLHRGASLSGSDWGTFTVDLTGKRVKASVDRTDPGASAAIVAGLTGRSVVSLRQTPATEKLAVDVDLDSTTLDVTSSAAARLDALAVSGSRYTQATLDKMPTKAKIGLIRGTDGARIRFSSTTSIRHAELHNYVYADGALARAASVEVRGAPPSMTAAYTTTNGKQILTVDSGHPRAGSAKLLYFDRAAAKTVLRAELSGLPAKVRLVNDLAEHRVTHTTSSKIGRFAVVLQRDGGAVSSPRGSHVTMIKNGDAVGVSGLLTGLSGFDVTYGAAPHAQLEVGSSGRSFLGAASIDGTRLARLEISNTPAKVDVTLDPAARKAVYQASGVIDKIRAAYTDTRSGPTIDGTIQGVHDDVKATWELGERSTVDIASSSTLGKVRIYANKAYVTKPQGEDVQAEVSGVRKHVQLVADTAAKTLTWTSDGPVRSVSALARANVEGRYITAAAEVTGVPARFDAAWSGAAYRFRGLSGPVGSAAVAFANHDGAKAPAGPHLSAHYDEATGDLDASVRVKGLRTVEFSPGDQGFTADFKAARQTLALDTDVTRGDLRFGLLGRLGPLPGRLAVSAAGGALTYSGSRLDVTARAWLGKAGALKNMAAAPAVPGGISLVDGGCVAGSAGCGQGAFCTERGCFGVQGYLDVSGLPDQVTVDLAKKAFTFAGFAPKRRSLGVYLASTILAPVPIKARATLTGLPSKITSMSVGPFDVTQGNAVQANYRIEPAATLGSLDLLAEAGTLRGHVAIDPVPAAVAVQGSYGAQTRIRVTNSAAVKRLSAKVTVDGAGTGELRFGDVPARFGVDADASGANLRMPTLTYKALGGVNTLDGHLAVEGGLIDRTGRLGDVSLDVTDLAADTTVRLNPDQSLDLVSRPVPTGRVQVHGGLTVDPVARQRIAVSKEIPYTTGFLSYQVGGQFGLGKSTIKDLSLDIRRMAWLRIRPGKIPFGMKAPPALGYIAPGFEGNYGRLALAASGVSLRPDVNVDVKLSRKLGNDIFHDTVRIGPVTSLALRRYDQRLRRIGAKQAISAVGVQLACLTVDAKPGFAANGTNSITLRGADGPQMVSLLDPGGQVPDYAVDLLTHFMSPFPGADWKVAGAKAGHCATGSPKA